MSAEEVGDAASEIGDHAWEGAGTDEAPAAPPVDVVEDESPTPVEDGEDGATDGAFPEPPPQAGPGSSGEAWRDYAKAVGVDVPADAKRDVVIAAVKAMNLPV
jgi:hypothetical protein